MPKDALLYARLQQLGLAARTFRPEPPSADTLALVHDPAYVRSFLDGSISPEAMRRIGLPWSEALVRRALVGVGSAVLAARLALQFGVAVMCNGGTHHAHPAHGSGELWGQEGVAVMLGGAAGPGSAARMLCCRRMPILACRVLVLSSSLRADPSTYPA